jgi:hypothetical protein
MTIDHKALFESDCRFAEHIITTKGELAPMFAVHFERDGELGIAAIAGDFADGAAKDQSVRLVKMIGAVLDASSTSLMTEAWVATQKGPLKDDDLPPCEREDRREVVMVTMSIRDQDRAMVSTREILRGADGRVTGLAPAAPAYERMEGRMSDLLLRQRLTPEQREQGLKILDLLGIKLEELTLPH